MDVEETEDGERCEMEKLVGFLGKMDGKIKRLRLIERNREYGKK
jgi:hypothetical protein